MTTPERRKTNYKHSTHAQTDDSVRKHKTTKLAGSMGTSKWVQ